MNTDAVNKQDFQELIEKYLNGKTSLEEAKLLVNYYESFQQNQDWVEDLGPEDIIKNRVLINILETLQEEEEEDKEVKVISFYKKRIFQLGVAASLILFITFNFVFNKETLPSNESIIVNNNIKIGTDKATLTLENGTNITLVKGQNYTTNNITSNGEEIIYKTPNVAKKEIAYNYLTIPRGGQYHVKLEDGTEVWLNSESQLKYPENFIDGETRQVELVYGEAYFHVSPSTKHKGSHFKVLSGIQEIEVLGTEFNVKAYHDENFIYTTLVKGKVAISNGTKSMVLKPEEQSITKTNSDEINIVSADVYTVTSWRKGIFSFDNMELEKIMKVLARWYDFDVVFVNSNLKKTQFTGVLRKHQNIEEILETIRISNNIAYEINGNTVIFR